MSMIQIVLIFLNQKFPVLTLKLSSLIHPLIMLCDDSILCYIGKLGEFMEMCIHIYFMIGNLAILGTG